MIPEKIGTVTRTREIEGKIEFRQPVKRPKKLLQALFPGSEIMHESSRRRYINLKGADKSTHIARVKKDTGERHIRFKTPTPGAEPPKGVVDKEEVVVSFDLGTKQTQAEGMVLSTMEAEKAKKDKLPPLKKDRKKTNTSILESKIEVAIDRKKVTKGKAKGKTIYVAEMELKDELPEGVSPNYDAILEAKRKIRKRLKQMGIKTFKDAPSTHEWVQGIHKKNEKTGKKSKKAKK